MSKKVKIAKDVHSQLRRWVLADKQKDTQDDIKELDLAFIQLVSRKADFRQAKMSEEAGILL